MSAVDSDGDRDDQYFDCLDRIHDIDYLAQGKLKLKEKEFKKTIQVIIYPRVPVSCQGGQCQLRLLFIEFYNDEALHSSISLLICFPFLLPYIIYNTKVIQFNSNLKTVNIKGMKM